MNMALMDAGIVAWKAKFQTWLCRPSQADPSITLPVGLPPFPSYVSGHSAFSGAASRVLARAFPSRASAYDELAEEASQSRIYGGIHFPFDCAEGLRLGRLIGEEAASLLK
jgi:membrane-associated phospholipid phosphatase